MGKLLDLAIVIAALLISTQLVYAVGRGPLYNSTNSTAPSSLGIVSPYTVNIMYNSTVGYYLSTGSGYTLYMYTPDKPGSGLSTCYNGCAKAWPPYYTSKLVVPSTLNASAFSSINRTDGSKQLTYKGYPLYTYIYDTNPGQVNGQGVGNVWYVLTVSGPATPAPAATTNSTGVTTPPIMPNNTTNTTTTSTTTATTTTTTTGVVTNSSSLPPSSSGSNNVGLYIVVIIIVIVIIAVVFYLLKGKK